MRLRNIDLNLLVALDVLLEERHVTRAALRLGLTQSAMSNALARLRASFDDDLLIKTSSGMEPTARAAELHQSLRAALGDIERIVDRDSDFRPELSTKLFRLRMSDVHNVFVLPSVCSVMESAAPNVRLSVVYMPPRNTIDALLNDEIDLAIAINIDHQKLIKSVNLYADKLVCVMKRGHPAEKSELTLDKYLELDHIDVTQSPVDRRLIDDELARLNRVRRIPLKVQQWLLVPNIVCTTNFVSATWSRIAQRYCGDDTFVCKDLPFGPRSHDFKMYWHRRNDKNVAHRWFRNVVLNSVSGL
jgi:DNA-binding transcriptional LysR family regulator